MTGHIHKRMILLMMGLVLAQGTGREAAAEKGTPTTAITYKNLNVTPFTFVLKMEVYARTEDNDFWFDGMEDVYEWKTVLLYEYVQPGEEVTVTGQWDPGDEEVLVRGFVNVYDCDPDPVIYGGPAFHLEPTPVRGGVTINAHWIGGTECVEEGEDAMQVELIAEYQTAAAPVSGSKGNEPALAGVSSLGIVLLCAMAAALGRTRRSPQAG